MVGGGMDCLVDHPQIKLIETDAAIAPRTNLVCDGRQFDFTRFTRLGHRRLFRRFDEIDSGVSCGPGVAFAWTARYFMLSFFENQKLRAAASLFARLTLWPFKYFDWYLATKESASDADSAFYFYGSKSQNVLTDRQLIATFRGGF